MKPLYYTGTDMDGDSGRPAPRRTGGAKIIRDKPPESQCPQCGREKEYDGTRCEFCGYLKPQNLGVKTVACGALEEEVQRSRIVL